MRHRRLRPGFMMRWTLAVAAALTLAGVGEYAVTARQVQDRVLEAAFADYGLHVHELEETLSAPEVTPAARRDVLRDELAHITALVRGTDYIAVFDSDGTLVADHGSRNDRVPDASAIGEVATSGSATVQRQARDVGPDGYRYEFLLPMDAPGGSLVLEIDQHAAIVEELVLDLRLSKALNVLLAILIAVPLSYLLGGRRLHVEHRAAQQAAETDALTGLRTRRPFEPLLAQQLERERGAVSLAVVDVDDFKRVNDNLGHSYGDRVLVAIAESFQALRRSDLPFRLGGDEFAVVLPDTTEAEAVDIMQRVRLRLARSMPGITISCGVADAPHGGGHTVQELWERADAALYEAKRRGRRRTVSFTEVAGSLTVAPEKVDALTDLLDNGAELGVVFQPIWNLRAGELLGHEALMRLPACSAIDGPGEAFELAERLGCAAQLDELARRATLRAVADQQWTGRLFLNVHPDSLTHLDVDALAAEVREAGLDVGDVVLEITEHATLDTPDRLRTLRAAHAAGFRLALDDMGQGNAGLRALTHVPFDVVKIDGAVVRRLATDPASEAVIAAAAAFVARSQGWIVAEGIEDIEMLTPLVHATDARPAVTGIVAGQGYLLGRPRSDLTTATTLDSLLSVAS